MTTATPDRARAIITDALRKIDDLSSRLEIAEKSSTEPIAVVGVACRFPGEVNNADQYWELLKDGRSGIVRVPAQRWDADAYYSDDHTVPGTINNREGGFLTSWQPDEFDAEFFAISPREAAAIDPQQRLLLEVACEALEDAGIPARTIRGTQTGVFVGQTAYDYMLTLSGIAQEELDAYVLTGNSANFAAGRLAYFLGARGPAMVLDTACSSSLTAIHLACQSLRSRESDTALVGGTNLMLSPGASIACSRWGMLAADGQCKTFDAGADGYVRSEGCGVVVLKRLEDAERDGDRVLAVVRGSAVNQDGASSGVTVPNGPAQQALLRQALTSARLAPSEIDYVEAHGTGTPLGDPIELEALGQVFADRGSSEPLILGSVKTNLGHLEAAAGVAGFIKTVLSLHHGYIPRHLNFAQLTPHATESASCLSVAAQGRDWPATGRPRRAGVSSFGVSGTNAHIVLEQAPEAVAVESVTPPAVSTLVVSGKSSDRVASLAGVLADWLTGPGAQVPLADVAHTLDRHRTRYPRFATVSARDHAQAVAGLRALAAGEPAVGLVAPHDGPCGSGTVFVYSGQGSQWAGMARQLLADEPAFAAAVAELEPDFVAQTGFSLHDVLAGGQALTGIAQVQPALVGVQLALTALWRSSGVEPDAVIGHSMGEVTAAVVAGALTPAEGLRVIATRSRLMSRLSGQGAMALLELDAAAAETLIADCPQVTVAVYASPRQTVIAGPPADVDALITQVAAQDRLARRIDVDVASHHPTIDPILAELEVELAGLAPKPPRIPILSTVDNAGATPLFDARHWVANLRNPVRFSQAIAAAGAQYCSFVEMSPHPLLTHAISDTLAGSHHHSLGAMARDADDTVTFHTALNTIRAPRSDHPAGRRTGLPFTPWHHTHHRIAVGAGTIRPGSHPLLGYGVTDPATGSRIWESTLGPDMLWLNDHRVGEACVLPGAAYAELALAAVTDAFGADGEPWTIRELSLDQVMLVAGDTTVVTTLHGDESKPRVEIRSRTGSSGWTMHATATLERDGQSAGEPPTIGELTELDPQKLYRTLRSAGQQHGPAFQGIVSLAVSDSGVGSAAVHLPSSAKTAARRFILHPVMMDIAMQTLGAAALADSTQAAGGAETAMILPVRLAGVRVYGDLTTGVRAIATLRATARADRFVGQVFLADAQGQVLLKIDEVDMAVLQAARAGTGHGSGLFTTAWEPVALERAAGDLGAVLVVGDAALLSGLPEDTHRHVVPADDLGPLREALARKDIRWDAVVVACPPRSVDEALTDVEQLALAQSRTLLVSDIVKLAAATEPGPRLWVVTRGAQVLAAGERVTLAQAELRGIVRVLIFEHPELKATIVDVDAEGATSAPALIAELLAAPGDDEVALRSGRRSVNRLVPAPTAAGGELVVEPRRTVVDLAGLDTAGLRIDHPGQLDILAVHLETRTPPAADQVEIRVIATGLNANDLLKTGTLGFECVGVVESCGVDVDTVAVGQRVIAFGAGALGTHLTTRADLVVAAPAWLPDAEAASIGIAYLTAWHALCEVGRLAPGERVLIHSATVDTGRAAVSVAKLVGARIYATAGSAAQREELRELGVDYVGDSHSLDFADEILHATDGYGVDVVLNSLPGEAIRRGVKILAPGGRFIELGTQGIDIDSALGLAALARSASFSVVDLEMNLQLRPQRYQQLLQEILGHVAAGALPVLPVTEFPFEAATDAFRLMESGAQHGRIVLAIPAGGRTEAVVAAPPLVRRDGGYVVVGGMGGLGLVFAQWLAAQGAGMIVLNGRSAPSAETAAAIEKLAAAGTRVEVVTGDIAEPGTAAKLLSTLGNAGFAPAGVLHSAVVLADEIVLNMTEAAAARVFSPKVAGSWWLHTATADLELDWWMTFSSASSLLGTPGQGAYAAANAWVDGLVDHRRSLGLPAVGINWGPWAEVGRAQFLAGLGISMITADEGMAAMQRVLAANRAHTGVFSLDAQQWFQSFPATRTSSLFARLAESAAAGTSEATAAPGRIRAQLDAANPAERPARLASAIADEIRTVLRSTEPLHHDQAMESLGLDSLMALELRNRLEASLGITLPAALIWGYPTITGLAGALIERMDFAATPNDGSGAATDTPTDTPGKAASGLGARAQQRALARRGATQRRRKGHE
ncbi:type I polyketide synthase [Mycolicibacterium komossense]|uniref:Type I polyketide synthase n=1 Tax=Mycolicibacterium komossense TaxID=1779 RepID=A0ABT3CKW0_9MYCO|nr:type I polyketide synthase [Mycolicibacterium komossense]MCV7230124.1 type I polyketide synthase [Mycolicibacterium komossense]